VISPFRGDVVVTGFVLAIPVFLLAIRGEFTADEVVTRLLWCLGAGWAAVAVVRFASTPPTSPEKTAAGAATVDPEPVPEDRSPAV
jgi:peptidoglycan/LPS O-acetylase OafA/YrhL